MCVDAQQARDLVKARDITHCTYLQVIIIIIIIACEIGRAAASRAEHGYF